jgi:hypothetical protein
MRNQVAVCGPSGCTEYDAANAYRGDALHELGHLVAGVAPGGAPATIRSLQVPASCPSPHVGHARHPSRPHGHSPRDAAPTGHQCE